MVERKTLAEIQDALRDVPDDQVATARFVLAEDYERLEEVNEKLRKLLGESTIYNLKQAWELPDASN